MSITPVNTPFVPNWQTWRNARTMLMNDFSYNLITAGNLLCASRTVGEKMSFTVDNDVIVLFQVQQGSLMYAIATSEVM